MSLEYCAFCWREGIETNLNEKPTRTKSVMTINGHSVCGLFPSHAAAAEHALFGEAMDWLRQLRRDSPGLI